MTNRTSLLKNDKDAINEFCERLKQLLGENLQKMSLFGSKAEGKDTADSDIDILVLIKDSASIANETVSRREIDSRAA